MSNITKAEADRIVREFQKPAHNNVTNSSGVTEPRLYVRDNGGNLVPLKALWFSLRDINQLINNSQDKLDQSHKKADVSGLRFYPALQDKDKAGNSVGNHHTLVVCATVEDSSGNQNNIIPSQGLLEFARPCPDECNTIAANEIG